MNIRDNAALPHNKKQQYNLIPLEDTSKFLSSAYLCVKDFFKILRSSPELMYKILTKAEPKDLNSSFVYFISNNFFNNILSSRTYSEEFLLIITHLLYDQISSLKKISDFSKLFENSNIFILLKGIKYQKDVRTFYDLVFKDIIEEYENSEYNMRPLEFKIDNIIGFIIEQESSLNEEFNNSEIDKKKEIEKKINNENNELNRMFKMKFSNVEDNSYNNSSFLYNYDNENDERNNNDSFDGKKFLTKYLIEIYKKDLIKKLEEESKEIIKDYIRELLESMGTNENFYGNSQILDSIQKSNDTERILYNYQKNFFIVIEIISKIIKKINECFELIPYNIKYLCKIITISLKKKFKGITNIEIYKYMGEFFFGFLFQLFFLEPDYGSLITSIIISKETKKNLGKIFNIWKKLVSFKLYSNDKEYGNYTPFNWFFLDSIHDIFNICEKILDFNLPDSLIDYENNSNNNRINNIGKDNLDESTRIVNNYTFPKNSSFYSYSICYNIYNLTTLLNIIKNNSNYIFENKTIRNEISEFEIIYKNIKEKKNILKKLKTGDEQTVNYYIYYEIFYSKKFQDILFKTIKQDDIFNLKEIKDPQNDEQIYLNKIIRIKNLLTDLLFKSENLSNINFNNQNIEKNNLEQIIQALSQYYKNKSTLYKYYYKSVNDDIDINYNDINIDNVFCSNINPAFNGLPLDWYANTLLSCFQELNNNNDNNVNKDTNANNGNKIDYHELFTSLEQEINNCINKYNFEELSQALESLKNMQIYINDYNENLEKYKKLNLNTDIRNFIENEEIKVEIKFRYNKQIKFINIVKTEESINSKFEKLDEYFNQTQKDDVINCSNISEFIKKFPPLTLYAKKLKISVFIIEKDIKVKKKLINYLKIVKEHIKTKFRIEEANEVYEKVKTIIMIRLYDKLFPKKADIEDEIFYHQCLYLSWVEPKHLGQENLFFDNFLPITTAYFEQINNEKSAGRKLEIISKIFEAINNVIIFNKGGNFSTDDIAPIFEYALIKAHPKRISSNLKYLQIFMKNEQDCKERMYFDYLNGYMNIIKNATYADFNNITEEEFNRKYNEKKGKYIEQEYEL